MADVDVDVAALYGALEGARAQKELSWREVARQVGVSASTMSRLAQGLSPDITAFARMIRWLNVKAESFIREDGRAVDPLADEPQPELVAQLAPLLRARKDLNEHDVRFLEELIESAMRRFNAERTTERATTGD